ncbi:MAG TPA: hypothetical protein VN721_06955 [Flavipsychrobacter sp.]|nr:hypothetical protein [Flavipsychrobacter sp.]
MGFFKQIATTSFLVIAAFTTVTYVACNKDKCGGTTCQNGGTCIENKCVCSTGYNGSDCGTSWSTEYTGTYSCTQTCRPSTTPGTWTSSVTTYANSAEDTVVISNFGNSGMNVNAGVDSSNHIYILPSDNAGNTGNGSGSYNTSNNTLTINYTSGGGVVCTMVMTKQ